MDETFAYFCKDVCTKLNTYEIFVCFVEKMRRILVNFRSSCLISVRDRSGFRIFYLSFKKRYYDTCCLQSAMFHAKLNTTVLPFSCFWSESDSLFLFVRFVFAIKLAVGYRNAVTK